jgi:hypothetical protein
VIARSGLARFDARRLEWLLRIATAGALIGHGGFGWAMAKPEWTGYAAAAGLAPTPALLAAIGLLEIALGLAVLARPAPAVLLFVVAWKIGTELLRPLAGEPIWEFVERWSNYTAPLALLYVRHHMRRDRSQDRVAPSRQARRLINC